VIAAVAAGVAAIASPSPPMTVRLTDLPGCAERRPEPDPPGAAWWRMSARAGPDGELAGWRLVTGAGDRRTVDVVLPPESGASGPVDGAVVVVADDGRASTIALLDARTGCREVAVRRPEVIRRAVLDPTGRILAFHAVDRATRADLGVESLDLHGDSIAARRVVPPFDVEFAESSGVGTPWSTGLTWTADSAELAVQSCSPSACAIRVADVDGAGLQAYVDPAQGELVTIDRDRLVTWEACLGLPCGLRVHDRRAGVWRDLADDVVSAREVEGGGAIAVERAPGGDLAIIDPATGAVGDVQDDSRGLLAGDGRALEGVELPDGWLPLGEASGSVMRLRDGRVVSAGEVR
jgi:hypothetical protein